MIGRMRHSKIRRFPGVARPAAAGENDGSALVITLAIIVLATVAILAFYAQTLNALFVTKFAPVSVQADSLVGGAVETAIGDFRHEMLAGAEPDPNRTTFDAFDAMTVRRRAAMAPARAVSENVPAEGFESLVKQSLRSAPFYPASATYRANGPAKDVGPRRASAVSTAAPSLNGRLISAARWDKVALTAMALPDTALPDWIYATRHGAAEDGATLTVEHAADDNPGNSDFVVGRYAYNIYDVGGLLDINAAGFSSKDASLAERKGGLPWADLTAIGLSQQQVDSLVGFRNPVTLVDYLDGITYGGEKGGFLSPRKNGGDSDGYFYSRQDMLHFFLRLFGRKNLAECSAGEREILASLTQDTLFLAAPSWNPDPKRKKIQPASAGGNMAEGLDDKFNPGSARLLVQQGMEFTRLRFEHAKTLTGPREIPASAGEPLLNSRFALSRLRLLTRQATATANDPIQRYFGLTRSSSNEPWIYNHGEDSRILRLEEIASGSGTSDSRAREPDMVELLQAAILAGSVGKSSGALSNGSNVANTRDQVTSYQIIQIFANLIDQFDSDGFPTCIEFDGKKFYGIENLPYLTRAKIFLARLLPDSEPDASSEKDSQPFSIVFLPEIWNPHDQRIGLPPAGERPTNFRVAADTQGQSYFTQYRFAPDETAFTNGVLAGFSPDTHNLLINPGTLPATEPVMLKDTSVATSSAPLPNLSSKLAGLATPAFDIPGRPGTLQFRYLVSNGNGPSGLSLLMQYQDASGGWVTYFERPMLVAQATGGAGTLNANMRGRSEPAHYANQKCHIMVGTDPRTDRFSTYRLQETEQDSTSWLPNRSIRPDQRAGYGLLYEDLFHPESGQEWTLGAANPGQGNAMGTILQNLSTSATRYTDPDGVLRPGDGALASGSDPQGQMFWPDNAPSRPVVLNRPFRSVAEMGYAFRGTPCRSLDFFSADSGDAALLDFFSTEEGPADGLTGGRISAQTPHAKILAALLRGALADEADSHSTQSDTRADEAARHLVDLTTGTEADQGPLLDRSELVTRYLATLPMKGSSERIKRQREVFVRALADALETRTWNVLIDLIAQTGRVPKNAKSLADFQVASERHVWVHLALDRMTGRVLNLNLEPVNE